jgi:UDPglucose--hexose-1-phosphate uridylyltransferase
MPNNLLLSDPHRRYNPLKDEWVLVSPQRTKRPWQGKCEEAQKEKGPVHDPSCYMCPGNVRAGGAQNPKYTNTYVFPNDFPAMIDASPAKMQAQSGLFQTQNVSGTCRVVCFSPRHDQTLANMSVARIKEVINTWINQVNDLQKKYQWLQIFENKGELMGCSNPHPHGQIWAGNFIPHEIEKEDRQQKKYYGENNRTMLSDYLRQELKIQTRVVAENDNWAVIVPFWAVWPFETILLPKKHIPSLLSLSEKETLDLARIMKSLLTLYDKLFNTSMPYSMGWHFAPLNQKNTKHWQLHAHYYPPLLRSATIKKFMVGYEMLCEAQRDITAEEAAERLTQLPH